MDSNIEFAKGLMDQNERYDVVVQCVFPANEVGHYLSHKLNATVIMYSSYQSSIQQFDEAIGLRYNSAISPHILASYE